MHGELGPLITFHQYLAAAARGFLLAALERNKWNVAGTARELDLDRTHVYTLMHKLGIHTAHKNRGGDVSVRILNVVLSKKPRGWRRAASASPLGNIPQRITPT